MQPLPNLVITTSHSSSFIRQNPHSRERKKAQRREKAFDEFYAIFPRFNPKLHCTMILHLSSPWLTITRLPPPPKLIEPLASASNGTSVLMPLLLCSKSTRVRASLNASNIDGAAAFENPVSELLDDELIGVVSGAKDADEVLRLIADKSGRSGGTVSVPDCRLIIAAALKRNNSELALSVFYAMRSSFYEGVCL